MGHKDLYKYYSIHYYIIQNFFIPRHEKFLIVSKISGKNFFMKFDAKNGLIKFYKFS